MLNVSRLISPIKRHRLAEWIKTTFQVYVVDKAHTLDLKSQIGWKWNDRKRYSTQIILKKSWSGYILVSDRIALSKILLQETKKNMKKIMIKGSLYQGDIIVI